MSPNFVHCMYLIFEPILLRRKFWGISLHRNEVAIFTRTIKNCLLNYFIEYHFDTNADTLNQKSIIDLWVLVVDPVHDDETSKNQSEK